ncbi:MAG: NfeD family protein [Leptolyngbyaceae bacterium]|nr:NfeD family protein [Leptolyngbyaceae bacterium]
MDLVSLAAIFWLIVGITLCVMELFLPTAFMEVVLGISAILVAFITLIVPSFGIQVAIWMVLSLLLLALVRRFLPKSSAFKMEESREAQTLTSIPIGDAGRVLYEGGSWRARCGDETLAIAANEPVYVVARKGNTLVVVPKATAWPLES